MKIKIILLIIFTLLISNFASKVYAQDNKISQGVMLMAYPAKTLSTAVLNEGDTVYFINAADLWVNETKVIPSNAVYKGIVTMLKMPVKGINATIKIKITSIIFEGGTEKPFSGVVIYKGNEQIGGNLTPPASYNKMVHPREGIYWKRSGILQFVPSGDYEMGQHITIQTSEPVHIMLNEDFISVR